MISFPGLRALCLGWLCLTAVGCTSPQGNTASGKSGIGPNSVGSLALGMTLSEATSAVGPANRISQSLMEYSVQDGSGHTLATFFLRDGGNPNAPGNGISEITARSGQYVTPSGIRPGMRISEVEKIHGPASITQEVEGTGLEIIRFANQPGHLTFTSFYPAGIYDTPAAPGEGERRTKSYRPEAIITGITVR